MGDGKFPTTRYSAIHDLRNADAAVRARSLEILASAYWKPAYKYLRVRWTKSPEDARDLTQAFFATAIEKNTLSAYVPGRARFRTYLRACLDHFAANHVRAAGAIRRGGGVRIESFDFDAADRDLPAQLPATDADFERYFEQEWAKHVLSVAVDTMRSELAAKDKQIHFRIFERHDLAETEAARPSHAALAAELGVSVTDVGNRLAFARREFRRIALDKLRELTATDEEFEEEAERLLGVRLAGQQR